jgi:hypothetical protein
MERYLSLSWSRIGLFEVLDRKWHNGAGCSYLLRLLRVLRVLLLVTALWRVSTLRALVVLLLLLLSAVIALVGHADVLPRSH